MIIIAAQDNSIQVFESRTAIPADANVQTLAQSFAYCCDNDGFDVEFEGAKQMLLDDIEKCTGCNAVIIQSSGFEKINACSASAFVIRATLLRVTE